MNNWNDIVNKPHTSGVYNVVYGTDEGRFTTSCYFDGTDTWYHDVGINYDRIVTANVMMWQPLPEIPEADGRIKAKDGLSSVLDDIQNANIKPVTTPTYSWDEYAYKHMFEKDGATNG